MTREDIIRMARGQGLPETSTEGVFIVNTDDLGRMLAAERERLTWTDAHWTEYERGIVATERERIAAWVEDMCVGLDAKTIANGIRNDGNDDIRAFEVRK